MWREGSHPCGLGGSCVPSDYRGPKRAPCPERAALRNLLGEICLEPGEPRSLWAVHENAIGCAVRQLQPSGVTLFRNEVDFQLARGQLFVDLRSEIPVAEVALPVREPGKPAKTKECLSRRT